MTALISQAGLTDTITLGTTDFDNIVSTVTFTLLLPAAIRVLAYNILDPSSTQAQIKIDGTVVLQSSGGQTLMINKSLAAGTHTVDYQAITFGAPTTTTRGLTVEDLNLL
jgi:hypothetical protein